MPVHTVIKNGMKYYQWGNSGKLYKNKEKAIEQGRAAYANGYNDKKKDLPETVKKAMNYPNKLGEGAKKRKRLGKKNTQKAVIAEYERGTLHSGNGKIVKNKKQAVAIAISEASKKK